MTVFLGVEIGEARDVLHAVRMRWIVAMAVVLVGCVAGCVNQAKRERTLHKAFSQVQPQADFVLGCPAELSVLQDHKGHPLTIGAQCDGRTATFRRESPKDTTWQRSY